MSGIGRSIFARGFNGLRRRFQSYEGVAGQAISNGTLLRRFLFYGGVVYCSGEVFKYFIMDYGASEGPSMYPTMQKRTPFTLISKLHSHGKDVSPGDIVNFTSPIFRDSIAGKRVIGISGDYVVLDPHQAPSVGGASVPGITDWRSQKEIQDGVELKDREEPTMIEVPEGHIYVVGDNMSWSRDSRFFGSVPMALVNGKQLLHGGFGQGWQWTTGEQLRKIPKEEEEAYLRGWKQSHDEVQGKPAAVPTTKAADEVD